MAWTINELTKTASITYTPGEPEQPYDPGQPYVPPYCTTQRVETTRWYYRIEVDPDTGEDVYLHYSVVEEEDVTRCYPAQQYIAPTPYSPGAESKVEIDYRLGWNSGAIGDVAAGDGKYFQTKIYPGSIGAAVGLTDAAVTQSEHYRELEYAAVAVNGQYAIYRRGELVRSWVDFDDELFRFEVHRGKALVYVGGYLVYEDTTSIDAFVADSSFYSAYDGIYDAAVGVAVENSLASVTESEAGFAGNIVDVSSRGAVTKTVSGVGSIDINGTIYSGRGVATGTEASYTPTDIGRGTRSAITATESSFNGAPVITGTADGDMLAMDGLSGDGWAAEVEVSFQPMTGQASADELAPNVAVAAGMMSPLTGVSIGLSGGASVSSDMTMLPLQGISADYDYADSRNVFEPMSGFAFEAQAPDMYLIADAPGFTGISRMMVDGLNAMVADAPGFDMEAFTGSQAVVDAPGFTLDSTATIEVYSWVDKDAPGFTLDARLQVGNVLRLEKNAPGFTMEAATGSQLERDAPGFEVESTLTVGAVMRLEAEAPGFTLSTSVTTDNVFYGDFTAPAFESVYGLVEVDSPGFAIEASLIEVVVFDVDNFSAYSVNLKNEAMTDYSQFPFQFMVRFQGEYYGFNADGGYQLDGATDNGTKIPWSFELPPTDFQTSLLKRLEQIYLGADSSDRVKVTATADEEKAVSVLTRHTGRNRRATIPKGLSGRFWSIKFENTIKGSPIKVDEVELLPTMLRRKV